jgi:hypothetical protein
VTFPLSNFLNQTCSYEEFLQADDRDDPTYADAVTLPCRLVEVAREQYQRVEDVRQSHTKVLLLLKPVLRSLISGREVISVTAMVQVHGSLAGWEAVLR